jgi:dephospho-CoA kinase
LAAFHQNGTLVAEDSIVIGLTGNIATGKSTVSRYLAQKGAHVIDADVVSHQVMQPDGEAYTAIVAEFGPTILQPDGRIDRSKLGAIVFADAAKLSRLEFFIHPAVCRRIIQEAEHAQAHVIILEAIKLLEVGTIASLCDEIWVITARPETQVERARTQRGMADAETRRRMQMQSPQAAKINQADRVIANDGTLAELYAQLDLRWAELMQRFDPVATP